MRKVNTTTRKDEGRETSFKLIDSIDCRGEVGDDLVGGISEGAQITTTAISRTEDILGLTR